MVCDRVDGLDRDSPAVRTARGARAAARGQLPRGAQRAHHQLRADRIPGWGGPRETRARSEARLGSGAPQYVPAPQLQLRGGATVPEQVLCDSHRSHSRRPPGAAQPRGHGHRLSRQGLAVLRVDVAQHGGDFHLHPRPLRTHQPHRAPLGIRITRLGPDARTRGAAASPRERDPSRDQEPVNPHLQAGRRSQVRGGVGVPPRRHPPRRKSLLRGEARLKNPGDRRERVREVIAVPRDSEAVAARLRDHHDARRQGYLLLDSGELRTARIAAGPGHLPAHLV
mmetsp:Transcript_9975/g.24383  ORF Transcript_9975/g.24383 Transcript_9975/m.24383 type:complete len:282 (+) Transcript_9975:697-1542(+)